MEGKAMQRYHKDLFFPDIDKLNILIERLNRKRWGYTGHSFEKIKERASYQSVICFIRDLRLKADDVFEYYKYGDIIEKICLRIEYSREADIILVVNQYKGIVTVYFNNKSDRHISLNPKHYCLKGG